MLAELELRPLGWRARRRALAELRDQLLSALEDGDGSPEEREQAVIHRLGSVEDVAATPATQANQIAALPCAEAWNRGSNARWQAYAARLGSRRAFIGIGEMVAIHPKTRAVHSRHRSCVVKLWLARLPGRYQEAVDIAGVLRKGGIVFGTRMFSTSRKTPTHVRQRTAIQFANSRVRSDGTLDFVGVGIP